MSSANGAGGRGRLGGEHVEPGAQALVADRGGERRLVDHFGPGGVDRRTRPASGATAASASTKPRVSLASARWMLRTSAARTTSSGVADHGRGRARRSPARARRRRPRTAGSTPRPASRRPGRGPPPPGRCCRSRAGRACGRSSPRASSTPSCSRCRRAARRRCRECGDRAPGSGRGPARRRRPRSCPDSSTRRCRAPRPRRRRWC